MTRKRIPTLRPISIGESIIESKPAVKYLGLMLDFFEQIETAAARAEAELVNGEHSICLLTGASQSVLLYGAEVQTDTFDTSVQIGTFASQTGASGVCVSYCLRTGGNVIAGVMTVALLAKERKVVIQVLSLTCTGLGRRDLQIVCSAMERGRRFFSCERWGSFRQQLYADTGDLSPDLIIRETMKNAGSWSRAVVFLLRRRLNSGDRMARGSIN